MQEMAIVSDGIMVTMVTMVVKVMVEVMVSGSFITSWHVSKISLKSSI